jgi:hypothetical protein
MSKSVSAPLLLALSAAIALGVTGCSSSGSAHPSVTSPPSTSGPAPSASPSSEQSLATDEQLDPVIRYSAPSDFEPAFTFKVPSSHWYPYLRGGSALNLREAKSASEQDAQNGIEIVGDSGSLAKIVHSLLTSSALRAGPQHPLKIGGRSAVWFDVTIRLSATLHAPASLDGEQVEPGQGLRVYAISGASASVLFLVFAPKAKLTVFLPQARALIRSVRV